MQVIGKALGFDPVGEVMAAERAGYDGVRVIDHFFSGLAPEPPWQGLPICRRRARLDGNDIRL